MLYRDGAASAKRQRTYEHNSSKRFVPIAHVQAKERHLAGRQTVLAQEGGVLLPRLGAVANKGLHGVWQVTTPPQPPSIWNSL